MTGRPLRAGVLAGVVAAPGRVRVPGRLHRALLRGLRVDPRRRFADMRALLAELEGVRRGRPLAWLGLGVLALGVGAALGGRWSAPEEPVPPDMCASGAARAEAVWGPTRKAAVRRAFLATDRREAGELWTQVSAQLDAYALAWVHGHESACHAAHASETSAGPQGELTEGPYLTMACLDRSLGELRALTDAFIVDADAVIGNAVKASYKLRPLEECRARPVLALLTTPPSDPTTAVQVQALATRLDEISARLKAGEIGRGIPRAREAAAQARALAHDHTTAEALVLLGSFESLAGEYGAAERSLFDAALLAERGDNRAALARARTELVFVVGYGLHRFDEGLRWGELAGNAMHSLGPGGALEVRLRSARGLVHRARGDLPSARAELVEALALAEATLGPDNPGVATALINLAGVQAEAGERSAARQALRRALTIRERTLGVDHPDTKRAADEVAALDAEPPRTRAQATRAPRRRGITQPPLHRYVVAQRAPGVGRQTRVGFLCRVVNLSGGQAGAGPRAQLLECPHSLRRRGVVPAAPAGSRRAHRRRRRRDARAPVEGVPHEQQQGRGAADAVRCPDDLRPMDAPGGREVARPALRAVERQSRHLAPGRPLAATLVHPGQTLRRDHRLHRGAVLDLLTGPLGLDLGTVGAGDREVPAGLYLRLARALHDVTLDRGHRRGHAVDVHRDLLRAPTE